MMNNNIMNDIHEDIIRLITVYLTETASEEEVVRLLDWISLSSENKAYFDQLRNIWEASDRKLDFSTISTDKALAHVMSQIKGKQVSAWFYWQKIAAVLLIPILLANVIWFAFNPFGAGAKNQVSYNEVFAAYGTRSSIKLADGSQVWLNSGSSLKYPDKFVDKNRVVYLKGEAYFEVHSDKSQPFIVQTQTVSITATGTKFNVNAFATSKEVEVTLASGKVSVARMSDGNVISDLKPNQHLVYDTSAQSSKLVDFEDVYEFISWKDGKLIFRNEPLASVVKKISQIYNVDIKLKGSSLQDYRYRATFENETLSEILKMLALTAPIEYKELKREMKADGSFPLREIIISEKKQTH